MKRLGIALVASGGLSALGAMWWSALIGMAPQVAEAAAVTAFSALVAGGLCLDVASKRPGVKPTARPNREPTTPPPWDIHGGDKP